MKTYLIKLPTEFVVVSDEQIEINDFCLMFDDYFNLFLGATPQQYLGPTAGHHLNKGIKKVIAREHEINFYSLAEKYQREIGWLNLSQLTNDWYESEKFSSSHKADPVSFHQGLKKAQELLRSKNKWEIVVEKDYSEGKEKPLFIRGKLEISKVIM